MLLPFRKGIDGAEIGLGLDRGHVGGRVDPLLLRPGADEVLHVPAAPGIFPAMPFVLVDDRPRGVVGLVGQDVLAEGVARPGLIRSEEHTSELQSLMRISAAVTCLNTQIIQNTPYSPSID